jgi:hypothetical protein
MSAMWERRLLSVLIVTVLAAIASRFEMQGLVPYVVIPTLGLIALVGGTLGAERLEARRHHTQT